jgi:heme/copper-type cytochrome/quinol oxidase subunit 3
VFRLALFFAAPIALFFIIYGAYYYITSAGDEERVKKGKNILINTLIATLILLASFTFLVDISENFTL